MATEEFEKLVEEIGLAQILIGGRAFADAKIGTVKIKDDLQAPELRLAAVEAMGNSNDIQYYPVLRSAAMTEPDANIRKAIRVASDKLEDVFGEDECLAYDKEANKTGEFLHPGGSEEAHVSGDYLGANLNDFR